MTKNSAPPPELHEILDPLGAIRNHAKYLWQNDGSPKDRDWATYWSEAERIVLGGEKSERSTDKAAVPTTPQNIPAHILRLQADKTEEVLSLLASAFGRTLELHECLALSHILLTHELKTVSHSYQFTDLTAVAKILAELAAAPPPAAALATPQSEAPSRDELALLWIEHLKLREQEDSPLTYLDRNTIQRLREEIVQESRMRELSFRAEPSELG